VFPRSLCAVRRWLPKFWWHHVTQPDARTETLSLNFWLSSHSGRRLEHYEWLSLKGIASTAKVESFWVGKGGAAPTAEALRQLLQPQGGHQEAAAPAASLPVMSLLDLSDGSTTSESVDAGAAGKEGGSGCVGRRSLPDGPTAENAVLWLHAGRMMESAAFTVCGGVQLGGRLLTAMADGKDGNWPAVSKARQFARRLRTEVADVLGSPEACDALLELLTMDGRLHPGLAPPVVGPIVSAERGDITQAPPDEALSPAPAIHQQPVTEAAKAADDTPTVPESKPPMRKPRADAASARAAALSAALSRAGGGAAAQALAALMQQQPEQPEPQSSQQQQQPQQQQQQQPQQPPTAPPASTQPVPQPPLPRAPMESVAMESHPSRAGGGNGSPMTGAIATSSLQALIFHSADHLDGCPVRVDATCVVCDLALQRLDLSDRGAKLIVHVGDVDEASRRRLEAGALGVQTRMSVTGILKKQGRRIFLEALEVSPIAAAA
jgi:hypothetical protein